MVFRDKAPIPGVQGIVPVVTHHEVIILRERVAVRLHRIYEYASVTHFQRVVLIVPDDPFVEREIVSREADGRPFLRYPERTEFISGPSEVFRERKYQQLGVRIVRRIDVGVLLH